MKRRARRAFTLMEVLVAAIIVVLALVGLANVFVLGKQYIQRSRSRLAGGELGKLFIDPLQTQVRQDEWDSLTNDYIAGNDLAKTGGSVGTAQVVNAITYTPTYIIGVPPGYPADSQLRRVRVDVNWTEN